MSNPSITADKTPWYQWDTGLTVTVSGGEMTECHFANRKQGTAYVQAVINGVARVPDELLQVAAPIKAYGYVSDGAGGQTYVEQSFEVIARNIPVDYTYTKTAQKTIRDAEAARDQAVQAAKDAKGSELAADDSAVEASNSAQSAGESASAAATSASNAAKSAGEAAKSASDAKAAAGKAVEDASELLKTYTDNAKTSADNAATSARNAADAASAASGSASAAEQSATDANSAKVAAQTAKADAATSASNAATSASNAESSATAAAKSASDAAASVNAINVIAPKTVGEGASAYGNSIAFGRAAICEEGKGWGVAIGDSALVKSVGSVMIGSNAHEVNVSNSANVAIGDNATIAGGEYSVAIGAYSKANGISEFSVGAPKTDYQNEITREITHVSTPAAPTSAATKKYTDDNYAKTLSEAKKYTDANTSNALVGNVSGKLLHVDDAWPGKPLGLTIDGAYKQNGTPSPEAPVQITVVENPVLHVTGADTSSAGTSLPITLPSEHPYLAALPDGTHDEIVIDKDGNVKLVARVSKFTLKTALLISSNISQPGIDGTLNYVIKIKGPSDAIIKNGGEGLCSRFVNGHTTKNRDTVRFGANDREIYVYTVNEAFVADKTSDGISSFLSSNATDILYQLATPVTYQLGKITMPSLPETISNVWTDAELTTDMRMTYKRDINVAYENLVQAVVAAAAGE